jgi:hypothetical protein
VLAYEQEEKMSTVSEPVATVYIDPDKFVSRYYELMHKVEQLRIQHAASMANHERLRKRLQQIREAAKTAAHDSGTSFPHLLHLILDDE